MDSRRDFLKKATLLAGSAGVGVVFPNAVLKAMAINPEIGSTYQDAEHIVFLMQENRSFDHMFGKMSGVRGFNDPHPHIQPDGNKVWLQKDGQGYTYAPFHVDINKTKITWQGGLPHSWNDQLAARNGGNYDKWVPVKTPMSLAYYDRHDIPFYYAMGDAFTICDQHFCSSLTGTTPNRLFFFTGTVRGEKSANKEAVVNNEQAESQNNVFVDWPTFQETLEDNGIDWKIYQNELWTAKLPEGEVDDWLGNYGDNPIEYIKRHQVKLSSYFRKNGDNTVTPPLSPQEVQAKYDQLSQRDKNLIDKAFTTNISEEDYLDLSPFTFTNDQGKEETINIPKGDIFHQFRKDVDSGKLPTVSWLVAPQRFSDHTSSPLYGTWYVSEALDILTKNPAIWKKTIFILTYDENDGYFDHQPPYVVPNPADPLAGKVSDGINYATDFENKKASPIGLGYRVPFIVASPWSKGGFVNSQVFDHTSSIMFMEKWLSKKTGKQIRSNNISDWRRSICGDLTSVFRPYLGDQIVVPDPLKRDAVVTNISNAKNKPPQIGPTALNKLEIAKINSNEAFSEHTSKHLPKQEKGTRPACALPYHLNVDGNVIGNEFVIRFESVKALFGAKTENVGAPFNMNTATHFKGVAGKVWAYAVKSGDILTDRIDIEDFDSQVYDLAINGPNGFYRHFIGNKRNSEINISAKAEEGGIANKKCSGNLIFSMENKSQKAITIQIVDNKYKSPQRNLILKPKASTTLVLNLSKNANWYDFTIQLPGSALKHRYAGKIETGEITKTDPYMGNVL
ncbi:phosphocholine-specific phospholipase C [Pedobacter sandarakinus]|uniref:phosphocholine-specific phospholipase C n=1 Tax=Pedobacter sandarakinus TaxID=353156 RepID=UPI002248319B|nr:phospholipase C, phosphocholine-specific [Pedobacter sandarakinus]MCX2573758.1 phospholipase C, phosphocholine-specific [Pedobacter sandarakinus]